MQNETKKPNTHHQMSQNVELENLGYEFISKLGGGSFAKVTHFRDLFQKKYLSNKGNNIFISTDLLESILTTIQHQPPNTTAHPTRMQMYRCK